MNLLRYYAQIAPSRRKMDEWEKPQGSQHVSSKTNEQRGSLFCTLRLQAQRIPWLCRTLYPWGWGWSADVSFVAVCWQRVETEYWSSEIPVSSESKELSKHSYWTLVWRSRLDQSLFPNQQHDKIMVRATERNGNTGLFWYVGYERLKSATGWHQGRCWCCCCFINYFNVYSVHVGYATFAMNHCESWDVSSE